eukprot:c5078_g1_i1.p1 GENE.c5078_g1_i1~~c5078_g1_i1.p1  ORF type:complete len:409 (-),score=91.64 c5078_g1_i1:123-1256(-)
MGQCSSTPEVQQNKEIDSLLRNEKRNQQSMKMLLLGPGGSGKSTIFKQVKIIFADAYQNEEERKPYIEPLHANAIETLKKLIDLAISDASNQLPPDKQEHALRILHLPLQQRINPDLGKIMHNLWKDTVIQNIAKTGADFTVSDATHYLLDRLPELSQPTYVPTIEDVVRCRVRTSGIVEQEIRIKKVLFKFVDVGGQRGERKKWIHCFDNVQALVYVAAISEYDQVLSENYSVNRLIESLQLFGDLVRQEVFHYTATLVFLNKCDILQEKMKRKQGAGLQEVFPEYKGGFNYDNAVEFLIHKFQAQYDFDVQAELEKIRGRQSGRYRTLSNPPERPPERVVYFHITNATSKHNMTFVFEAVYDIIIRKNLRDCDLT